MSYPTWMRGAAVAVVVASSFCANRQVSAQEKPAKKTDRAWTLEEAQAALALHPRDPYLQYVVLQLARRENMHDEVAAKIEELIGGGEGRGRRGRTDRVDLFSVFTGALAVQESLQLDTLADPSPPNNRNPVPAPAPAAKPQLLTVKKQVPFTVVEMVPAEVEVDGVKKTVVKPIYKTAYKEVPYTVPLLPLVYASATGLMASTTGGQGSLLATTLSALLSSEEMSRPSANKIRVTAVMSTQVTKKVPVTVTAPDGTASTRYKYVTETVSENRPGTTFDTNAIVAPSTAGLAGTPLGQGPLLAMNAALAIQAAADQAPAEDAKEEAERLKREKRRKEIVDLVKLTGPEIKSHPWKEMLAGRTPEISPLARCVPDDFYFAEFRSLNKLLEAMEISDLWSTHVYHQAAREARTHRVGERLKGQLAVETSDLLRPFYDLAVAEVAVTGSDLYLREGSDVTLIFQIKQPELFKTRMDGFLKQAEKAHAGARSKTGEFLGIPYSHVWTPDRDVHVFSAYPRPDLHVRSNSVAALRRVLEAIRGKDAEGKAVRRLGDTLEFAYIRTLLPRGAKEEDGLIYLSDPFIRRQVGPRVKLTEQRRMLCYNHLRMIGHAAMLYRTEFGRAPKSLAELVKAGCAPGLFGDEPLACPDGGKYALSADGNLGVCADHGHAHFLTPGCENALAWVTGDEADAYADFLADYNQYWRTYFDPIAIRIQISPQRYRLETIVLPLIDNSVYRGLALTLGGKPEPLDSLPVPKGNIFSMNFRINKEGLRKELDKALTNKSDEERVADQLALLAAAPGAGLAAIPWLPLVALHQDPLEHLVSSDDIVNAAKKLGVPEKEARKFTYRNIMRFLDHGLGNQIGLHVYDAEPHVDFNMPRFFGDMIRLLNGQFEGTAVGPDILIGSGLFLLTSANSPAYFSVPIQDETIVDDFIDALDALSVALARRDNRDWLDEIGLKTDFYRIVHPSKVVIRGNGIKIGPVTWRFFAARIGKTYYIATKQYIIEDLIAAEATRGTVRGETAHAMVRIRPENWHKTLPDYRLGWAENNRQACLCNLGPLSNVGRAFGAALPERADDAEEQAAQRGRDIAAHADRLHTVHFFCPDDGRYLLSRDARTMTCSIHGSAQQPRQHAVAADQAELTKLLRGFNGMTVTLTFLEDGLRAVLTIDRK